MPAENLNLQSSRKDSPLLNLFFSIVLPIIVLDKGSRWLGTSAIWTLIIALSIPIVYGFYDYYRTKNKQWLSFLGALNVALTGLIVILDLKGSGLIVKEAIFPFLIGIFVCASAFFKKPAISFFILNPQLVKIDFIEAKIREFAIQKKFQKILKKYTVILSASFFLSTLGNLILGLLIFIPIDPALSADLQQELLNQQIKQMTIYGFLVLSVPLTGFLMWILISSLNQLASLVQVSGWKDLLAISLEDSKPQ